MATSNKLVEDLGNGFKRETNFDGPATETENARNAASPPFHVENVAASTTATAIALAGCGAEVNWMAPYDGFITGVIWTWTAAPTHSLATVQATIAGTVKGDVITISAAQTGRTLEATPIAVSAGDKLGVKFVTDANFTPDGTDDLTVCLLFRAAA